ncbi:MAG: PcfB family protein [Oscillospiraceae bacterium]|nr:PcfB family protein [Oscillospiraceae bacterium]
MDVSAEAADLVVKEGIQATESAVRLAGSGLKNVAALLLALARQDNKVIGQTTAKRLARDPAPAVVIPLEKKDMAQFKKLAKEYGILYFFAQKKGSVDGRINLVSNENYAAQLNAVMVALGYPIPQKTQENEPSKKARPRAPQERSSPERWNGSTPSPAISADTEKKESVRARLEGLRAMSAQPHTRERTREKVR